MEKNEQWALNRARDHLLGSIGVKEQVVERWSLVGRRGASKW